MLTTELLEHFKNLAKAQGITQNEVAIAFGISLPTVKRWFSGKGITIEQADKLATYLGTSLGESLISVQNTRKHFTYTLEQEKYLSHHPKTLAFFDLLLRKNSAKDIEKKFKLSEQEVFQFLYQLDKLQLIELQPKNKFKLKAEGEPNWRKNGPLQKKFSAGIFKDFLDSQKSLHKSFSLTEILPEDSKKLDKKIEEILIFVNQANSRASQSKSKKKSIGFSLIVKDYQWSLDDLL